MALPSAASDASHLRITMVLLGSLPMPPSLEGDEDGPSPAPVALRKTLVVQCPDEESLGLWLAALRTLLAERKPPSPIGPAACMGSFGAHLDEVALADASLGDGRLLVPAVVEALWQSLARGDEGLATEGIFRLSAAESELSDVKRRIQEADESERALAGASACCLAALIKLFLRELPDDLWAPVRPHVVKALDAPPPSASSAARPSVGSADGRRSFATLATGSLRMLGVVASPRGSRTQNADGDAAAEDGSHDGGPLGRRLRDLLPMLPRRSADLIVWICEVMAAVVRCEADNRMGTTAVTAVLAPVLMRGATMSSKEEASADPLSAMAAAQRSVKLAAALLAEHRRNPLQGRGGRWTSSDSTDSTGSRLAGADHI